MIDAKDRLPDFQRLFHQGDGFRIFLSGLKDQRQAAQAHGHAGIHGPDRGRPHGKRPPEIRLGRGQISPNPIQFTDVMQRRGKIAALLSLGLGLAKRL